MGSKSGIEWTDSTWNFVYGCDEVSPGCDNCYARKFTERWKGVPGHRFENGFEFQTAPDRLEIPLKWREPRLIFVNSLSDLFHRSAPKEIIAQGFDVMRQADWHIYQILTKRPERMEHFINWYMTERGLKEWAEHIWLGTSVESSQLAFRADVLRRIPAKVRFLSMEPLLGSCWGLNLKDISWVIVGGESGPGARPMHPSWVRIIKEQCKEQGVPFFFKQWGNWVPWGQWYEKPKKPNFTTIKLPEMSAHAFVYMSKNKAGNNLDGKQYMEMPKAFQEKGLVLLK